MDDLHDLNAYEWINRHKGIIPSVLGRSFPSLPDELVKVASGLKEYGVARGFLKKYLDDLPPTGDTGDRPAREEWGVEWAIIR
jgi:hypothetical protein